MTLPHAWNSALLLSSHRTKMRSASTSPCPTSRRKSRPPRRTRAIPWVQWKVWEWKMGRKGSLLSFRGHAYMVHKYGHNSRSAVAISLEVQNSEVAPNDLSFVEDAEAQRVWADLVMQLVNSEAVLFSHTSHITGNAKALSYFLFSVPWKIKTKSHFFHKEPRLIVALDFHVQFGAFCFFSFSLPPSFFYLFLTPFREEKTWAIHLTL